MKTVNVCLVGLVFVVCAWAEPLLEGTVRLESGEPVADAQVRIFDLSDLRQGAIARAMTDGTGYFALPLAALGGRALPARFALGPNYPNPFNPSTIIPYQLAASSQVRLEVFNLLGQRITTLVDEERPAGFHTATWTATDGAGRAVGAGVYIYRMTVEAESQTGRMVLIDGQAGVSAVGTASVMPSASGVGVSNEAEAQVYGLIVSGRGLAPYVDSSFRVAGGMAPVELVVSSGSHSAGKAMDDDCALCDLLDVFNDQQEEEEDETEEEEAETDSTSSEGGPDLIVQSPSVSAVALMPGQEFTLNATVHNQGDEQAAATMLHYYRSNNATITSSDTEVGTDAIDALDASATSEASIALTAPTGISPEVGIYYGACVASVSGESHTDNNCSSAVKITVSGQETPEEEDETPEEEDETPEEEVPDGPVVIPDANLRAAIEATLGKASGSTITKGEMATLKGFNPFVLWNSEPLQFLLPDGASISDLTGLEFATNLEVLEISSDNGNISDLSPLRGLSNLTELQLDRNKISDLSPLRGLTNLRYLHLSVNMISDLSPLRGLNLEELYLMNNKIADLSPLMNMTNLRWLYLGGNKITDLSPLRGLNNLTGLFLTNNGIADLSPLRGLNNLIELLLGDNKIADLSPLMNLANLVVLDLRGNPLSVSSINNHIPALKATLPNHATVQFDKSFREGEFEIELVFHDDRFTEEHKKAIREGARRWMSIIREDLPDYVESHGFTDQSIVIPSGERIDDLRIYVIVGETYGAAATGAPILVRETGLPVVGKVTLAPLLLSTYSSVELMEITIHEIGHVLGIGTLWYDLLQGTQGAYTHFKGPLAIRAFDDAGGRNYAVEKVPVNPDGFHWRNDMFRNEVLSFNAALGQSLSAITVQALADLGWVVDVTQADPFILPPFKSAAKVSAKITAPSTHAQPEWTCGVGEQREPIYVVDQQGRIILTLGD